MGERVTFQVHNSKTNEYGPIIYLKWGAEFAYTVILRFKKKWANKEMLNVGLTTGKVAAHASFVFGEVNIWNAHSLSDGSFPGDAGAVLLDVATGRVTCLGGYLASGEFNDD